jgi:ribosomal protein L11 methyltransferase
VIRLAIRVPCAQAELVLADLLELAPSGVEESAVGEDTVEYAVYGAPGELPELPDLRAVTGGALLDISTTELPDDWSERWKQFHRPVLIEAPTSRSGVAMAESPTPRPGPQSAESSAASAPRGALPALYVRPPWEPPSERRDVREIVIDPAQAFGTGAHASTRICLELLLELAASDDRRGAVLDVGTGSGVLAIAAAHLGFAPVLGLDNEDESVLAARENAAVNGVALETRRFDLRVEPLPWGLADGEGVILANLLRPLLLELARTMPVAPRDLLASGLLVEEVDEVVAAFARLGLRERERRHGGEWAAVWLSRSTESAAPSPARSDAR